MGVSRVPDIRESGQIRECQWPAASPGQYLAYPKCSFFFNSACWAMPAGSRSAAQSAGGRKKDEIWDLVKNVEEVITKGGKATGERSAGCANSVTATLEGGPNIIMARTMEFMEAARRMISSAAGTPRQTPGQDERAACRYRAKSCAVDGVLAGG